MLDVLGKTRDVKGTTTACGGCGGGFFPAVQCTGLPQVLKTQDAYLGTLSRTLIEAGPCLDWSIWSGREGHRIRLPGRFRFATYSGPSSRFSSRFQGLGSPFGGTCAGCP